MAYKQSTYYISAYAKLSAEMPSGGVYKGLDMGFVIDMETGMVVDTSITLLTEETRKFIKDLIVGFNLNDGVDQLTNTFRTRYHGTSQKAICVVIKLIYEKYILLKKEYK